MARRITTNPPSAPAPLERAHEQRARQAHDALLQYHRDQGTTPSGDIEAAVLGQAQFQFVAERTGRVAKGIAHAKAIIAGDPTCLVPNCNGVIEMPLEKREELWDRYYTGAPVRQRQFVERYNKVKRA